MKHTKTDSTYIGFADISLSELLTSHAGFVGTLGMAITRLDSSNAFGPKTAAYLQTQHGANMLGPGVAWVAAAHIEALIRDPWSFQGFDEIYLCAAEPALSMVPKRFTTEIANFGIKIPDEFLNIFRAMGAEKYASDGAGLNFVTADIEDIRIIEGLECGPSIQDPGRPQR